MSRFPRRRHSTSSTIVIIYFNLIEEARKRIYTSKDPLLLFFLFSLFSWKKTYKMCGTFKYKRRAARRTKKSFVVRQTASHSPLYELYYYYYCMHHHRQCHSNEFSQQDKTVKNDKKKIRVGYNIVCLIFSFLSSLLFSLFCLLFSVVRFSHCIHISENLFRKFVKCINKIIHKYITSIK